MSLILRQVVGAKTIDKFLDFFELAVGKRVVEWISFPVSPPGWVSNSSLGINVKELDSHMRNRNEWRCRGTILRIRILLVSIRLKTLLVDIPSQYG